MEEGLQRIYAALDSSVEEIRYQAAKRLLAEQQQVRGRLLIRLLGDDSWRVRKFVVEHLSRQEPDQQLVEELVAALSDQDNAGLRNAAAEVLTQLGEQARPQLEAVLSNAGHDERKLAADILGEIGSNRALPALLAALDDEDENVRAAAVEAIGQLGDRSAVERLVSLMHGEGLMVRLSCLDALDRLGAEAPLEILLKLLETGPLRPMVYRLLGRVRRELVLPILIKGLQARGRVERSAAARALVHHALLTDRQGRVALRVELVRLGDELVDALGDMLAGDDREEREAAVMLLGWSGRQRALELLLGVVDDVSLREMVQEALLEIGRHDSRPLQQALERASVRQKAILLEVMGRLGDQSCIPHLLEAILDEEEEVCQAAEQALAQVAHKDLVENLVAYLRRNYLHHARPLVGALRAIGRNFRPEVIAALQPLLQEQEVGLRRAAAEVVCSLARSGDEQLLAHLGADADGQVRAAAVAALGRIGTDVNIADRLKMALTDENQLVRLEAVRAIANRGGARNRELLSLALRDGDPLVVREAVVALARTATPEVGALLRPLVRASHPLVAGAATRALMQLGWDDDPAWLDDACAHSDAEVFKEVLAGCGRWPVSRVAPLVCQGLRHASWTVRLQAAKAAAALGDEDTWRLLQQVAAAEPEQWVRQTMEQIISQRVGSRHGD